MVLLCALQLLYTQSFESVSKKSQNGSLIVTLQDDPIMAEPQDVSFQSFHGIVVWIHVLLWDYVGKEAFGGLAFYDQDLDGVIAVSSF